MNRIYSALLFVFAAAVFSAATIHVGYTTLGFLAAGTACAVFVAITIYTRYTSKVEDTILQTGLIQHYLLSNFTADQSTLQYLKKLLEEDYNLTVTTEQLTSAIEKEQTRREIELEKEELSDFKNKFFIKEKAPETLEEYIKQFVAVFGRGSVRNVYYLKKVLDEENISYSDTDEFTDTIVALKNLIEAEVVSRGGEPKKEEKTIVNVCSVCGNEYPKVLLFCPFCEQETTKIVEPSHDVLYCPQCNKPMIRSILKRDGKFVKGYQCRNLKCLYEMTYEESQNT
jgi:hypothetical protein